MMTVSETIEDASSGTMTRPPLARRTNRFQPICISAAIPSSTLLSSWHQQYFARCPMPLGSDGATLTGEPGFGWFPGIQKAKRLNATVVASKR
jgi:hypothetical protein